MPGHYPGADRAPQQQCPEHGELHVPGRFRKAGLYPGESDYQQPAEMHEYPGDPVCSGRLLRDGPPDCRQDPGRMAPSGDHFHRAGASLHSQPGRTAGY